MTYNLIDINEELCEAWEKVFAGVQGVQIIHDSIFNHPCDAFGKPRQQLWLYEWRHRLCHFQKSGLAYRKRLTKDHQREV